MVELFPVGKKNKTTACRERTILEIEFCDLCNLDPDQCPSLRHTFLTDGALRAFKVVLFANVLRHLPGALQCRLRPRDITACMSWPRERHGVSRHILRGILRRRFEAMGREMPPSGYFSAFNSASPVLGISGIVWILSFKHFVNPSPFMTLCWDSYRF